MRSHRGDVVLHRPDVGPGRGDRIEELVGRPRCDGAMVVGGVGVVEIPQAQRCRHGRRRDSNRARACATETHRAFPAEGHLSVPSRIGRSLRRCSEPALIIGLAAAVPFNVTSIDKDKLSTCLQVLSEIESLPPEHPDAVAVGGPLPACGSR